MSTLFPTQFGYSTANGNGERDRRPFRYNISHLSRETRVLYLGSTAQNGGGENSGAARVSKGRAQKKDGDGEKKNMATHFLKPTSRQEGAEGGVRRGGI